MAVVAECTYGSGGGEAVWVAASDWRFTERVCGRCIGRGFFCSVTLPMKRAKTGKHHISEQPSRQSSDEGRIVDLFPWAVRPCALPLRLREALIP